MKITRWDTGATIYEDDAGTIKKTLENALSKKTNFQYANLRGANLQYADLQYVNLRHADLRHASLQDADLRDADFRHANLRHVNLQYTNLWGANLLRADLRGANLQYTNLWGANLRGAKISLAMILQASWGELSDKLALELMRHDALLCGEEAMTKWAKEGGPCPFKTCRFSRAFHFAEEKELWAPGLPQLHGIALLEALCKEKEIKL